MIQQRKYAQLIEAEEVKSKIGADINVDDSLIVPCIRAAQERWTRDVCGPKLYEYLMSLAYDGLLQGEEYDFVVYYLQPALIEWTAYTILGKLAVRIENNGIMDKSSDNSQSAELDRLHFIRSIYKNDAETMDKIILKALYDSPTSFQNYRNDCCSDSGKKSAYSSGIFIEKRYKRGY